MQNTHPLYDLDGIIEAVSRGDFEFERRASRDATNLGYFFEDRKKCLCSLTPKNFLRSRSTPTPADSYKVVTKGPNGTTDELYIKLKHITATVFIESFKLA